MGWCCTTKAAIAVLLSIACERQFARSIDVCTTTGLARRADSFLHHKRMASKGYPKLTQGPIKRTRTLSVWASGRLIASAAPRIDSCQSGQIRSNLVFVMNFRSGEKIDIISEEQARGTLPGLFLERTQRTPNAVAYCEYREADWIEYSWIAIAHRVFRLRGALTRSGLKPSDRVAVLLPNSTDWVAFDIAAMANGLITVPLYAHDSNENISYVLANSGARLCLIDTAARWAALAPLLGAHGALEHVWVREELDRSLRPQAQDRRLHTLRNALENAPLDAAPPRCNPQDVATIVYTSGTTGRPKGVMLTHCGILWNAGATTKFVPPLSDDIFLSLLPLAHAFERTVGYYLPMMGGSRVVYGRSVEVFREDLATVRPTVIIAVPRLYERICEAARRDAEGSPLKRGILAVTADTGWRLHEWQHSRGPDPGLVARWVLWPLLKRLVARRVLATFGGRLRVAVSSGAALPTHIARFLIGLGLPLLEGYGLTEAAPVVTAPTIEDNLPGSVGRPLHGLDARLGERSELIIRSPAVMQGYWQDAEATARALSPDGWLKTGDTAEFRDGYVFITGRLKDILVLSTGENVAPTAVEAAIQRDPLFDQVCVTGDRRPCLVAVAVLNPERWLRFAHDLGIDPSSPNTQIAADAILSRLALQTQSLPSPWQVRAVHSTTRPWTVKDGSLTPTLKIKRRVIEERFNDQIDTLYKRAADLRRSAASSHRG